MSAQFLDRLKSAHDRISRQIESEGRLVLPDDLKVSELKKLRLSLKDRMARISASQPKHA